MLFHEIYSSYFHVVSAILTDAVAGTLTGRRLTQLVQEQAFSESVLTIPDALNRGDWPLLDPNYGTPVRHAPVMPLTTLEKRWLKALLLDPRVALFDPCVDGLEDIAPLFRPDMIVVFDRYLDGDPYEDPQYIACFRLVLRALREHRKIRVRFTARTGGRHSIQCTPYQLEYSAKDDKFRLYVEFHGKKQAVNLARIRSCELLDAYDPDHFQPPKTRSAELTLLLHDERNALERVLLHFSHFEKETVRLEDRLYQITLRYDREDETELLIRVLSFGPMLEVTGPPEFLELIRSRLDRQAALQTRELERV